MTSISVLTCIMRNGELGLGRPFKKIRSFFLPTGSEMSRNHNVLQEPCIIALRSARLCQFRKSGDGSGGFGMRPRSILYEQGCSTGIAALKFVRESRTSRFKGVPSPPGTRPDPSQMRSSWAANGPWLDGEKLSRPPLRAFRRQLRGMSGGQTGRLMLHSSKRERFAGVPELLPAFR